MKIEKVEISIRDIANGYADNNEECVRYMVPQYVFCILNCVYGYIKWKE